ncbi:hypothetical protein D3C87_1385010 [compost metagenome]
MGRQVVAQSCVVVTFVDRRNGRERRRIAGIEQLSLQPHVGQTRVKIAAGRPPRQHLLDAGVVFAFVQLQAHTKGFEGQGQQFTFVFQADLEFCCALRCTGTDVLDDKGFEFGQQILECVDRDDCRLGQLILTRDQHAHVTTSNV